MQQKTYSNTDQAATVDLTVVRSIKLHNATIEQQTRISKYGIDTQYYTTESGIRSNSFTFRFRPRAHVSAAHPQIIYFIIWPSVASVYCYCWNKSRPIHKTRFRRPGIDRPPPNQYPRDVINLCFGPAWIPCPQFWKSDMWKFFPQKNAHLRKVER